MNEIQTLVEQLSARLPELEWKLKNLQIYIHSKTLSPGLFQNRVDISAQTCMAEVKADLKALTSEADRPGARYLTQRINQKINALVRLCQLHEGKPNPRETRASFGINTISTRQQWLIDVRNEIEALEQQQQALLSQLEQMQQRNQQQTVLTIKTQLGEVEKQLTLAKEALGKKGAMPSDF